MFRAKQFYSLFDKYLSTDDVRKLCHTIIALTNALSLDQTDQLSSISNKGDLLITLLQMLDRKNGGKELLVEACNYLSEDKYTWWPYLLEKVKQSKLKSLTLDVEHFKACPFYNV